MTIAASACHMSATRQVGVPCAWRSGPLLQRARSAIRMPNESSGTVTGPWRSRREWRCPSWACRESQHERGCRRREGEVDAPAARRTEPGTPRTADAEQSLGEGHLPATSSSNCEVPRYSRLDISDRSRHRDVRVTEERNRRELVLGRRHVPPRWDVDARIVSDVALVWRIGHGSGSMVVGRPARGTDGGDIDAGQP